MVLICVAANNGLYICIAEKSRTENTKDKTKDTPLDAAVWEIMKHDCYCLDEQVDKLKNR